MGIKMSKKYFIFIMLHLLPNKYFNRIRRRHPLCKYNFHSPVQIRAFPRSKMSPIADMVCVHCGINIDRDDRGQWRRDVKPTFLDSDFYDEFWEVAHVDKEMPVKHRELFDENV